MGLFLISRESGVCGGAGFRPHWTVPSLPSEPASRSHGGRSLPLPRRYLDRWPPGAIAADNSHARFRYKPRMVYQPMSVGGVLAYPKLRRLSGISDDWRQAPLPITGGQM